MAQSVGRPLTRVVGNAARASVGTTSVRSLRSLARRAERMPWRSIALSVWIAGAVLGLLRLRRQLRRQQQLVRTAEDWRDPDARSILVMLSDSLGLRRTPRVVVSDEVETPQVTGLVAPVVLLPRRLAHELSRSECTMTLCHELVHVRRRDLWMGWVPALAERVFWFHPLARLATHEYALAREAACDAEVLEVLEEAPQDYGRMLVRLGTARVSGLATAGVAPTARTLKRRLLMLQQAGSGGPRKLAWAAFLALTLLAIVPLRFRDQPRAGLRVEPGPPEVLRDDFGSAGSDYYEVTPELCSTCTNAHEAGFDAAEMPSEPTSASDEAMRASGHLTVLTDADLAVAVDPREEVATPSPEIPAEAEAPRAYSYSYGWGSSAGTPAPEALSFEAYRDQLREAQRQLEATRAGLGSYSVAAGDARGRLRREQSLARALASLSQIDAQGGSLAAWSMDDQDRAWVLVKGDSMMTGSGSSPDFRRARSVRRHSGRDEIFFLRDGDTEYVIEDPDFIASALALFEQDTETSRRTEELSAQQAELGVQQGELGRQQAELGLRQAELGVEIAKLQVTLLRAGEGSREGRRIRSHMDELNEKMGEFGDRQIELGEEQAELGERQARLGEEQARLGEASGEDSEKTQREVWKRIEAAREQGLAHELE
ncbi:MAG: M56 family metallopeptidase [Candidatus Eisenbacteria bacterium]